MTSPPSDADRDERLRAAAWRQCDGGVPTLAPDGGWITCPEPVVTVLLLYDQNAYAGFCAHHARDRHIHEIV
jgi:hypothetical protein